jgi:hydrogenase maturation protein HypF
LKTFHIHIKGLVQGVGFRPFINKIAIKFGLKGWVDNRNDGVHICITADELTISNFVENIRKYAPPASDITQIIISEQHLQKFDSFNIVKSKNTSNDITDVSPDIAVCEECLNDMKSQGHRIIYPFINCTNCGPRFTIIQKLPYDRASTTMKVFEMCSKCHSEYTNVLDRRYHAQPIACNSCGPEYRFHQNEFSTNAIDEVIDKAVEQISNGNIISIKGLGGFFIACDALNENAISNLRKRKLRDKKPFALMVKDIESVSKYAYVSKSESDILSSWRKPIVLLKQKEIINTEINDGLNYIGIMLPYMPLHYLLFEKLSTDVLIFTSGNVSDEPIITNNEIALSKLYNISDSIITYNRDIFSRNDDSIVSVVNSKHRIIRRSRGYVPSPINFQHSFDGIIATGAELANTFCIGKEKQVIMSQHIGDLKNLETLDFFEESIEKFVDLYRVKPHTIVCDMHPDYLSTQYAERAGLKIVKVQHHYAHILSAMAENNHQNTVIGVALDGTGYGLDGTIWGGEILLCDVTKFERLCHFEPIRIQGGDKASKETWRAGISYLLHCFGSDIYDLKFEFIETYKSKIDGLRFAIENKINSPLNSSTGRLFDAISAIMNLCTLSSYQAEAPMRLEAISDSNISDTYSFDINPTISYNAMIYEIVKDIEKGVSKSVIASKFHNTILDSIVRIVRKCRQDTGVNSVCLSGGVFMNRFLLEKLETQLLNLRFQVLSQTKFPVNDGGISLGQIYHASLL